MRGRRPQPALLKVLMGNPSHQRVNYAEPVPAGNLREPSEWLTEEQKATWTYLVANAPPGQFKQLDRYSLEVYVIAYVIWQRAAIGLSQQKNRLSKRARELQAIVDRQARVMRQYATELGFSPASRPRIQVTPEPDAEKSGIEKFLG
jgi:P27 family predicted phage terminase small subunit